MQYSLVGIIHRNIKYSNYANSSFARVITKVIQALTDLKCTNILDKISKLKVENIFDNTEYLIIELGNKTKIQADITKCIYQGLNNFYNSLIARMDLKALENEEGKLYVSKLQNKYLQVFSNYNLAVKISNELDIEYIIEDQCFNFAQRYFKFDKLNRNKNLLSLKNKSSIKHGNRFLPNNATQAIMKYATKYY